MDIFFSFGFIIQRNLKQNDDIDHFSLNYRAIFLLLIG